MPVTHIENYTVSETDIDQNDHMNNVRYVELIQEISKHHWFKLVENYDYDEDYYWVVLNHNIDYRASALLNDELLIETYVEKIDKLYSHRRVIIKHKVSGKICMNALTRWCLMNANTRKICRIPESFIQMLIDAESQA